MMSLLNPISVILFTLFASVPSYAKTPKNLKLSEYEVGVIRTAVGYTTMVQFNQRPTSVVLGDQDAFKIEYVGSGLAIKPMISRVKTNLFVFNGYDRYSFQLLSGTQADADYLVKVERKSMYPVASNFLTEEVSKPKYLSANTCNGLSLRIRKTFGEMPSQDLYVDFETELSKNWFRKDRRRLPFEAGDFDLKIYTQSLSNQSQMVFSAPIESLILMKLYFEKDQRVVAGTLKISGKSLSKILDLKKVRIKKTALGFTPDFLKQRPKTCTFVSLPKKEGS